MHDTRPIPHTSIELAAECINFCKRFDIEIMNEIIEDRKYKYFVIVSDKKILDIGCSEGGYSRALAHK